MLINPIKKKNLDAKLLRTRSHLGNIISQLLAIKELQTRQYYTASSADNPNILESVALEFGLDLLHCQCIHAREEYDDLQLWTWMALRRLYSHQVQLGKATDALLVIRKHILQ